jgi:hypothetical protein
MRLEQNRSAFSVEVCGTHGGREAEHSVAQARELPVDKPKPVAVDPVE